MSKNLVPKLGTPSKSKEKVAKVEDPNTPKGMTKERLLKTTTNPSYKKALTRDSNRSAVEEADLEREKLLVQYLGNEAAAKNVRGKVIKNLASFPAIPHPSAKTKKAKMNKAITIVRESLDIVSTVGTDDQLWNAIKSNTRIGEVLRAMVAQANIEAKAKEVAQSREKWTKELTDAHAALVKKQHAVDAFDKKHAKERRRLITDLRNAQINFESERTKAGISKSKVDDLGVDNLTAVASEKSKSGETGSSSADEDSREVDDL